MLPSLAKRGARAKHVLTVQITRRFVEWLYHLSAVWGRGIRCCCCEGVHAPAEVPRPLEGRECNIGYRRNRCESSKINWCNDLFVMNSQRAHSREE